jgi:hypothetical protein
MNPSRRARRILPAILAAGIVCAAAGASAQEVHKLVDPTGHVTFSDRPDETGAVQAAPESEPTRPSRRIAGISSPRAAAMVDTSEAARRLHQARLRRDRGIEPQPGEQTAGVPNGRYWQRQEKLRREVDMAQRRHQETIQPKLSSR